MTPTHGHAPHPTPVILRCPGCAADMVTYERSGIVLEQCRECRGIFLDRGELERLVDAESGGTGWAGPRMRAPSPSDGSRCRGCASRAGPASLPGSRHRQSARATPAKEGRHA
jgi:Zn-finger nucleic acid-binding protein